MLTGADGLPSRQAAIHAQAEGQGAFHPINIARAGDRQRPSAPAFLKRSPLGAGNHHRGGPVAVRTVIQDLNLTCGRTANLANSPSQDPVMALQSFSQ
jgi:hypothetical protein